MPDAHKNFAVSAVATAPSPATSGTSLVVTAGHGSRFPAVPFNASIWPTGSMPDPLNAEIVRVTAISTDTLTITRAQESTTARTVIVGDLIAATITVKTITDLEAASFPTALTWDAVNLRLGIGTATPWTPLHVLYTSADATNASGVSALVERDGGQTVFQLVSYHTSPVPQFQGRAALGTRGSPTAIGTGKVLFRLTGLGWSTSAWATAASARLDFLAAPAGSVYTDSDQGADIAFFATAPGVASSSGLLERMRLKGDGSLVLGGIDLAGAQFGNFAVNGSQGIWQRGSGAFTANNAFAADKMQLSFSAGSMSVSQDTANTVGVYSARCSAITYTYSSGTMRYRQYYSDWLQCRSKAVTVSMYVRAPAGATVKAFIDDGVTTATSAAHPADGAYARLYATMTPSASSTTLMFGLQLEGGTALTVYFDNMQIGFGTQPGQYWSEDPTDEKARCQVYYERRTFDTDYYAAAAGAKFGVPIAYGAPMVGTITATKITTGTLTNVASTACENVAQTGTGGMAGRFTVTSTTTGDTIVSGEIWEFASGDQ